MDVMIRAALSEEMNAVALLNIEAYHEYSHALTVDNWEMMQASLSNVAKIAAQGQLLVAASENPRMSDDREFVGSVIYYPPGASDSRLFQTEWASIRMLAVSPRYRGQGIGQQLSLACIDQAKQDRAEIIALHTSELMLSARRMYERFGFRQDVELPRSLGIRYWRYSLNLGAK
jgi:ribosomal protein S18 acetylase RimI-like enzyme